MGTTVTIGSTSFAVEVADTPELRQKGLSGHEPLAERTGMLFVFDTEDRWGIWMKDMRFSIDIVWADAQGTVVGVVHNATPESYPKVFEPPEPARYVLELPAGAAAAHGVVEGAQIVVQ